MMPQRIPIRSPIQQKDLKKEPEKQVPLTGYADVQNVVEQLSKLQEDISSWFEELVSQADEIKNIQKGEQGEQGEPGQDIPEPDLVAYMEDAIERIRASIPEPVNGIDGKTPKLGVDYFTPSHKKEIVTSVMKSIRVPEDGTSPVIDHSQLASDVISKILNGKMLKKEHIDGLEQEIASYRSQFSGATKGYVHGGGDTVTAGTGVTINHTPDGKTVINATAAGGLNYLAATGAVDNVNTTFTFASKPTLVSVNGTTYRNGFGVTITGDTAVLDNPAGTGGDVYGLG